jgi:hypothetical protein
MELSGLPPGSGDPDVRIRRMSIKPDRHWRTDRNIKYRYTSDSFSIFYEGVGAFLVRGGREIGVDCLPGAEPENVLGALTGIVMVACLHQRGAFVLHGNGLQVDDKGIVIIGSAGMGKSTLSAALMKRGSKLISDDICALDLDEPGRRPSVYPGYHRLKLWANTMPYLGFAPEAWPRVANGVDKHLLSLTAFQRVDQPVPLERIYSIALDSRPPFCIKKLNGVKKLAVIIENTYRLGTLTGIGKSLWHLQKCESIAKQVTIKTLFRSEDIDDLDAMVDLLIQDIHS